MNQRKNDLFAVLGVPHRFDLDPADLHRRFLAASAANHPDRYTDPDQQQEAARRAAQINEAYRRLADPETRAKALLALLGEGDEWDEKSLPPELLMEVLEIREEMEQAIAQQDHETLTRLRGWAQQQRAGYLKRIAEFFDSVNSSSGPQRSQTLQKIQLQVNALRYIQRMLEQMPGGDG